MALVRTAPSVETSLAALTRAAQHDLSCACGPSQHRQRGDNGLWIYPAALPSGQRVPMLKVLQAAGCERSCIYCVERCGGRGPALSLAPEQLATAFVDLQRSGRVFGLFLSSAIRGGAVATMDRMLGTAEILRKRHGFRGYIHLKMIPGSRPDQIDRAMALATRVSVNMEAPTAAHLARIAPGKKFDEQILAPMRQVARAIERGQFARAGQTTQFVVGAAGEADREVMNAAVQGYRELKLARVYYSAMQPIAGTPVAERAPVPFEREHRLYQVDFLLRSYGFSLDEIHFDEAGALPLHTDPKTLWARKHPERFPVEINKARFEDLVRIPGIGPRSAKRLLGMRRQHCLRDVAALRAAGASWKIASPFILLDGKPAERQLRLC
ncbi:MAG TPA: putative DNA modification/repair radical SAM protein [Polyangia bacterium]